MCNEVYLLVDVDVSPTWLSFLLFGFGGQGHPIPVGEQ